MLAKAANWLLVKPRLVSHTSLVLLALVLVLASSSVRPQAGQMGAIKNASGYGAYSDKTAAASVAANIATTTNLIVAPEAAKTAKKLNEQVALSTSGDDYLAKTASVHTAGKVNRGIEAYVVKSGDTITSVAEKFNITTNTLRWANNLQNGQSLKAGQKLDILPISGVAYTVKQGDTPGGIASRYGSDAEQIISFNNAEVKGIRPGQKIIIPDGVLPSPTPTSRSLVASAPLTRFYYGGNGYSYGYCTYYVAGRRSIPSNWGDARNWYYNAQLSGFSTGRQARPGAIAWTSAGYYGHVAYVEEVAGDQVLVSEMNYAGWNKLSYRWAPLSSFQYIY